MKPKLWQRMRAAFRQNPTAVMRPVFNVVEQQGSEPAEVYLYGDVIEETPTDWWTGEPIEGMYISLQNVLAELERVRDASEIVIHLNSSGGDLFAGIAIHNLIREFNGSKTVIVDGLAASAASVIMCAADKVQVHPGSMVMIHNVLSLMCGYYSTPELRDTLTSHEAAELSLVRIYEGKCKKSQNEIKGLIDATTWYVGQDAIDAGFADELVERDDPDEEPDDDERPAMPVDAELSANGEYLMVAGVPHLVANLGTLPPWMNGATRIPDVAAAARGYEPVGGTGAVPDQEEEDGMTITNAAELRSAYPDLVAAIEADAAANERQRIRDIQDVAQQIANPELVTHAMYDEPMTAAELALANLRAEGHAARGYVNQLEGDYHTMVQPINADGEQDDDNTDEDEDTGKANPANKVKPAPAVELSDELDQAKEQAAVNELVAMYNDMNGRC